MYEQWFPLIVIVSFAIIHMIEVVGIHARYAGFLNKKGSVGYSIQNSTFVFTRFFYILLMPFMGLIVDHGIEIDQFYDMLHSALFLATIASLIVYLFRGKVIYYYSRVIEIYSSTGKLLYSLMTAINSSVETMQIQVENPKGINYGYMFMTSFVYTVYSLGVFFAFTLAVNYPDYRSSLSHLSGIVNGFATLVFTIKIDPIMSLSIDKQGDEFPLLFKSFILGRLLGVGLFSQIGILTMSTVNGW
ncbi:hypothetical protein C1E23_01355 [Pseudoalteromonas phenolica]|uniref:DUF2837 domain-containing protein n=1 Tax=Pseudoalteromonas phenolica TaxID=161398 RepID=A0A4Q7ITE9_9GAMM|nr:DUF2837 family protein [Pseudoalteromonas phenolica]RZQ54959.1 hypothetical protein C1E23_01355 [Pseudoalteromonas phenolica]